MAQVSLPRRRILQVAGAGVISGTVVASRTSEEGRQIVGDGIVDSVEYRHGWAHIKPQNPEQVDIIRVINPHGQQIGEDTLGVAEEVGSFELIKSESYTSGRFTVEAFETVGENRSLIDRGYFSAEPDLAVTYVEASGGGWPVIRINNSGTGPTDIIGLRAEDGFPTPGESISPDRSLPIDPGAELVFEFSNDRISPTTTTEESEIRDYSGSTVESKVSIYTRGFGVFENQIELEYDDSVKSRQIGENEYLYFTGGVEGGED